MSRILGLMKFRESYGVTKGSPVTRLEEPPLGSLAPPGNLEENASHHIRRPKSVCLNRLRQEVYLLKWFVH